MEAEGAILGLWRRRHDLAASLFTELYRLVIDRISYSSNDSRHRDILHQPYPLPHRLHPDFFIGPTDLVWPIRGIVHTPGFDSDWERAHHLAGTHAVERRPIISLAVHQAC